MSYKYKQFIELALCSEIPRKHEITLILGNWVWRRETFLRLIGLVIIIDTEDISLSKVQTRKRFPVVEFLQKSRCSGDVPLYGWLIYTQPRFLPLKCTHLQITDFSTCLWFAGKVPFWNFYASLAVTKYSRFTFRYYFEGNVVSVESFAIRNAFKALMLLKMWANSLLREYACPYRWKTQTKRGNACIFIDLYWR